MRKFYEINPDRPEFELSIFLESINFLKRFLYDPLLKAIPNFTIVSVFHRGDLYSPIIICQA